MPRVAVEGSLKTHRSRVRRPKRAPSAAHGAQTAGVERPGRLSRFARATRGGASADGYFTWLKERLGRSRGRNDRAGMTLAPSKRSKGVA